MLLTVGKKRTKQFSLFEKITHHIKNKRFGRTFHDKVSPDYDQFSMIFNTSSANSTRCSRGVEKKQWHEMD